jgi:glycosyltransferase involved in cell wall biosynthesis
MNTLQLISSGGQYGAENMVIGLTKALNSLGCPTTLGVFDNQQNSHTEVGLVAQAQGLPTQIFNCKGRLDWDVVRSIRDFLKSNDIQILHTHGYKADLYGYAAARTLKTRLLATSHYWTRRTLPLRLYAFLDQKVLSRFHMVVAVSDEIASSIVDSGAEHEKVMTIDNGIDLSPFETSDPTLGRELQKGARIVVGSVGRLVAQKGFPFFLQAAQEVLKDFPEVLFVVVGEGPDRPALEALARDLRLGDHFIFAGQRRDMPGVYASFDIFVLPSLDEGMPIAILEALASRKPIVATRVGAVPKLIISERTGLLLEAGDVIGLAAAIKRLVADRQLRNELGENGHTFVTSNFSAEAMARKYLCLYENALKKQTE